MLAAILVAAAMATSSPSPTPSPPPLRIIATVRSNPFCGQFANHVNSAIGSTLANDATLGNVVVTLQARDLAGTKLDRVHEIQRLSELADALYKQYRDGEGQVGLLRALETQTVDPEEKAELKAAADALGGALYRQHLIQRDLDGFVAYLYAADMRQPGDGQDQIDAALYGGFDPRDGPTEARRHLTDPGMAPYVTALPGSETPDQDVKMADQAATDFITRRAPIVGDEMNAAAHIDSVSQRC